MSIEHLKFVIILYGIASLISGLITIRIREFAFTRDLVIKDLPAVALGWVNTFWGYLSFGCFITFSEVF